MAVHLPEPTQGEAQALIVGLAMFWGGWAPSMLSIPRGGVGLIGVLPMLIGFGWFNLGGVVHLAARTEQKTVSEWYRGRLASPLATLRNPSSREYLRCLLPGYFRRASRVLGWDERLVLGGLGLLLVLDLGAFLDMMTHLPSK